MATIDLGSVPRRLASLVLSLVLVGIRCGVVLAQTEPLDVDARSAHEVFGEPYQTHVDVEVVGFGRRGMVALPEGAIQLDLRNRRASGVDVQLVVDVQAHGEFRQLDQGMLHLEGSATQRLVLPVAALGIVPDRLETPAILTFRVVAHEALGTIVDGVVSPAYYLHQHQRLGVVLYDERTLMRRFRGGDLTGLFVDTRGRDEFRKHVKIFAGAGAGAFDPWASPPVLGSGEQTICVHWNYQSRDHGAGERYYGQGEPMAARGVKISVKPSGQQATVYHADPDSGCITIPLAGGAAKATVFAEARLGVNDNLHVRAFDSQAQQKKDDVRRWVYYFVPGPNVVHLHVPVSESSTLMAFGSFSAYRLDQLAPLTADEVSLDIVLVEGKKNSDADSTEVRIAPAQGDRKFVYGHEVGHWYGENQGFDFNGTYSWVSEAAPCWSKNGEANVALNHLLRSTEVNVSAFREGLVHFFSTLVWNGLSWSKPMFRYYKNLANYVDEDEHYGDLHAAFNRVDMAAAGETYEYIGGVRDWRDRMCFPDDTNRYSVELDWARFLMNYLDGDTWSDLPGADPTFAELVDHLRLAYTGYYKPDIQLDPQRYLYDTFRYLTEALQEIEGEDSALLVRWHQLAELHGVKPLSPVP